MFKNNENNYCLISPISFPTTDPIQNFPVPNPRPVNPHSSPTHKTAHPKLKARNLNDVECDLKRISRRLKRVLCHGDVF